MTHPAQNVEALREGHPVHVGQKTAPQDCPLIPLGMRRPMDTCADPEPEELDTQGLKNEAGSLSYVTHKNPLGSYCSLNVKS